MLKLIIVPLDGSSFGEQALPTALKLAKRDQAELELVHVYDAVPPWRTQAAPPIDPTLDLELEKDRAAYLDSVAEQLKRETGIAAKATLLVSADPVGKTLATHIGGRRADVVVMCTHGRSGLSRLWMGSVANDLVRRSPAPVLLLRPTVSGSRVQAAESLRRVLIPLDGTPEVEESVDHALNVAGESGAELILIHVVTPVLLIAPDPAAVVPVPDESEFEKAAGEYLKRVADRLFKRGVSVKTRVVRHYSPAQAILDNANELQVELIAMDTHAWGVLERLIVGSVGDKVLRGATVPVLMHRTTEGAERSDAQSKREGAMAGSSAR